PEVPAEHDHYFFFSSRRRHTRWPRDWSSDVCSSDLEAVFLDVANRLRGEIVMTNVDPVVAGFFTQEVALGGCHLGSVSRDGVARSEERRVGKGGGRRGGR